jgi:hypothetical protein
MSIATDAKVRELERRIAVLEALMVTPIQESPQASYAEAAIDYLKEAYVKKFGKKPHHLMKEETIRKAVA